MPVQENDIEINYTVAPIFMLRAPLLSLEVLQQISMANSLDELLLKFYSDGAVKESIFLASPELSRIISKWAERGKGKEDNGRLKLTLLKYLIRMSSRCTPFGMFAGVCAGTFGEQSKISLAPIENHRLYLRPDMQFLCSMTELITADNTVRDSLKFSVNSSLSRIGNEYRYIEYLTDDEGTRSYHLQSVQHSVELEKVLDSASSNQKITELALVIADDETSFKEASEYIHMLIDNQVLVSELEPGVSGQGYFEVLKQFFSASETKNKHVLLCKKFSDKIFALDSLQGRPKISVLESIIEDVTKSAIPFKENALIQADLKLTTHACKLSRRIGLEVENILHALSKLSRPMDNPLLEKFKENFLRRYEMREIPLTLAMDAEAGPGYLPEDQNACDSELLENISPPVKEQKVGQYSWTSVDRMFYRKLQHALFNRQTKIEIQEEELDSLPDPGQPLPMSLSMMVKIHGKCGKEEDKYLMQIESAGGSSAINLAGRFCYMDENLEQAMHDLSSIEQSIAGETILAEVVHLPQQRTGNILMRPVLRSYEIPYLASSQVEKAYRMPISDLMVSVRDDRIKLRSIRLNKYVLPRLSNAHNYAFGSLSMYRFLCDLQTQNVRSNLSFSWGPLEQQTIFLPRLCYKNFILQTATWNFTRKELNEINIADSTKDLEKTVKDLREDYLIPAEVVLAMADNELWLDLESPHCRKLFQNEIRNMPVVTMKEFVSTSDKNLVRGASGIHANEFVFFMHRNQ